ncbi:hypothetical protein MJO28_014993 [Puccinia striiformis f. sp. tritici]|uniref:Uncharacterized protein n=1 Tax=Puccinia striiformis f. sp. tritici TaxID=168172 RepID=A0ACC0DRC8_9BASI|nr:hypothetical protein MJO28_014993 [Puccinia striiformis f. sp. tritici]
MQLNIHHLIIIGFFLFSRCHATDDFLSDCESFFQSEPPTAVFMDQLMSSSPLLANSQRDPNSHNFPGTDSYAESRFKFPSSIPESPGSSSVKSLSDVRLSAQQNKQNHPSSHSAVTSLDYLLAPSPASQIDVSHYLLPLHSDPEFSQNEADSANPKRRYSDPILTAWMNSASSPSQPLSFRHQTGLDNPVKKSKHSRPSPSASDGDVPERNPFSPWEPDLAMQNSDIMNTPMAKSSDKTTNSSKKANIWSSGTVNDHNSPDGPTVHWFTILKNKKYFARFPYGILNTKKLLSSQDGRLIIKQSNLEKLSFDTTAFTKHESPNDKIYSNILDIIERTSARHNKGALEGKLVMTEKEFIEYHTLLHWMYPVNKRRIGAYRKDLKKAKESYNNKDGRSRTILALDVLLENKTVWFSHWQRYLKIRNPEKLMDQIESIKTDKMRDTIIGFVFYVEMIESIVPRSPSSSVDESGEEVHQSVIEEAFIIIEELFNPEYITHQPSNDDEKKRTSILEHLVIRPRSPDIPPALWKLLESWLQKFRNHFWNQILDAKSNGLITTKSFFNTIFFYSIQNLTTQLKNV